jgi:hypothetical protein
MTTPYCARPNCPRTAHHSTYCRVHHKILRDRGEVGMTPTAPALEHIEKLKSLGWDMLMIARESGVSHSGIRHLHRHEVCRQRTARSILSLPLVARGTLLSTEAVGTVRRIRALQRIGWTFRDIAEQGTMSYAVVVAVACGKRIPSFRTALAVREVYEKIGDSRGPSPLIAARAKGKGYPPPAAWDDDTIDDPNATPFAHEGDVVDEVAVQRVVDGHAKPSSLTLSERYAAAKVMIEKGAAPSTAATKLGLNRRNVAELTERLAA